MLMIASDGTFLLPSGTEMTSKILKEIIQEHEKQVKTKFRPLRNAYEGQHEILSEKAKPDFKPDHRIVSNFPKYIVDTFNGFFIGKPVKVTHKNKVVNERLNYITAYNMANDINAEISKTCSIYGRAYELIYRDENDQIAIKRLSPEEALVVYDDTIDRKPMYGIRYYYDSENKIHGSIADRECIMYFGEKYTWTDEPDVNPFGEIPIIEYVENEEKHGVFEDVMTLINAYNKVLSEKANDVSYYADAYMKILGAELQQETLDNIRDNRIINLSGDIEKIIVDFLQKPDSDNTIEHFLDRTEKLIFQLSMVANINEENFGANAGIALEYRLQSMSNMALVKERKFEAGLSKRYKVIFSDVSSTLPKDSWVGIEYQFSRNLPRDIKNEAEIAGALSGIVSRETQLKVLSIVQDAKGEIERIESEDQSKTNNLFPRGGES